MIGMQVLLKNYPREHKGEIIAIEIASGDFFLGKNEIEAYEKGIEKYSNKTFVYKKVGYKVTHFVGQLRIDMTVDRVSIGQKTK